MSFKLLAIRPLEGTDPSLLKGLKPNCVYRFYNEYDYLYEYDESTREGESFIDYQDQYFREASNKEDDYLKLEKKEIKVIKYNKELPDGFFGKNINVSAVVGENGSGKSSLLELFYYAISSLEDNEKVFYVPRPTVLLDVFLQEDNIIYRLYFNNRKIIVDFEKINELSNIHGLYKFIFTENVFVTDKLPYLSKDFLKATYNHVQNCALYGLNSQNRQWLAHVFNVGRENINITINPNRQFGNIDINTETVHSYRRLLIYVFGFRERKLLEKLYVSNYQINLDVYNISKLIDSGGENLLVSKVICDFLVKVERMNEKSVLLSPDNNNTNLLNEQLPAFIDLFLKEIQGEVYRNNFMKSKICDFIAEFQKGSPRIHIEEPYLIYYYAFIYAFKEFFQILQKSENYRMYRFLTNFSIQGFKKTLRRVVQNRLLTEYELTEKRWIKEEIASLLRDYIYYLDENDDYYLLKELCDYYHDRFIKGEDEEVLIEKFVKANNSILFEEMDNELIKNYNDDFIKYSLKKTLNKMKNDKNYDSFFLKQAVDYIYSDIFKDVRLFSIKDRHGQSKVSLSIDSSYFTSIKKIEDIPIALFSYEIDVVKTDYKETSTIQELVAKGKLIPFEFNDLSSGELQSVNSYLQVVYDLYQRIIGIKQQKLKVNLIFDEIEMHLHPEYQRKYLNDLIAVLDSVILSDYFNSNGIVFNFNILLSTHSPFILSDIPSQNVLKLKEGKPEVGDNINSFGANIHDLLADEFFLDKGFMGEFAKEKINSVVKFLYLKKSVNELDSNMSNAFFSETMQKTFNDAKVKLIDELDKLAIKYTKEEVEQHIKLIGEPLLAVKMKEMSDIAFKEN